MAAPHTHSFQPRTTREDLLELVDGLQRLALIRPYAVLALRDVVLGILDSDTADRRAN